MSSAYSSRFTNADMLRRLGITDPHDLQLGSGPVIPIANVLDLSRSLATEPVEGRAYASWFLDPSGVAIDSSVVELIPVSPGGLIIEQCRVTNPVDPFSFTGVQFTVQLQTNSTRRITTLIDQYPGFELGGIVTRSRVRVGYTSDVPVVLTGNILHNELFSRSRVFVPEGSLFLMSRLVQQTAFHGVIVWRELPEAGV